MKIKLMITMSVLILAIGSQGALADCFINGTITAGDNPDPEGPAWMYTLELTWDTGSVHGLSHVNLLLDPGLGTCLCQDFHDALIWESPVGYSDGYPDGCTVDYEGYIECEGDPSLSGFEGFLLKFEPIEGGSCEPGSTGTGTFVFYSDLPPAPIDEDVLSVVDKHSQEHCAGHLAGDFPAMVCDPVSNEDAAWGQLKGMFR